MQPRDALVFLLSQAQARTRTGQAGGARAYCKRVVPAQHPADLLPEVLLRVYREGAILSFWDFQQDREHLKENDTLLLIQQVPQSQ